MSRWITWAPESRACGRLRWFRSGEAPTGRNWRLSRTGERSNLLAGRADFSGRCMHARTLESRLLPRDRKPRFHNYDRNQAQSLRYFFKTGAGKGKSAVQSLAAKVKIKEIASTTDTPYASSHR